MLTTDDKMLSKAQKLQDSLRVRIEKPYSMANGDDKR